MIPYRVMRLLPFLSLVVMSAIGEIGTSVGTVSESITVEVLKSLVNCLSYILINKCVNATLDH